MKRINCWLILGLLSLFLLGAKCERATITGDKKLRTTSTETLPVNPIPEPTGYLLFGAGLLVTGFLYRKVR